MKDRRLTFKPATKEAVTEFYDRPPACSFKGYMALLHDDVVGVGGIFFEKHKRVLFSDMADEMRPFKRDIVLAIRKLQSMVDKCNYPLVALASSKEPLSGKILRRMGFTSNGQEGTDGMIYWRNI